MMIGKIPKHQCQLYQTSRELKSKNLKNYQTTKYLIIQGITIKTKKKSKLFSIIIYFHKRLMDWAPTHCPLFMPHWWFPACSFQAL